MKQLIKVLQETLFNIGIVNQQYKFGNINLEISMGKCFSNALLSCPVNLYLKSLSTPLFVSLNQETILPANLFTFIFLRINVTNKQNILSAGIHVKDLNFEKIWVPNKSFQIFMNSSLQMLFFKCKGSHLA